MDFIAFDMETADVANTAPCSLGLVIVENNVITDVKHYLINPEADFNPLSMRIHGIHPDDVCNAPTFKEVWEQVAPLFEKYPVVCHNASFDLTVLRKALTRYCIPVPNVNCYCTMKLSRARLIGLMHYRLPDVCNYLGIDIGQAHHADDDAKACANIFIQLCSDGCFPAEEVENVLPGIPASEIKLDDFQRNFVFAIVDILTANERDISFLGLSVFQGDVILHYFLDFIRLEKLRKKYYIPIFHEDAVMIPSDITQDSTKTIHRAFVEDISQIYKLSEYIINKFDHCVDWWAERDKYLKPATVKKTLKDYSKEVCMWVDYVNSLS